MKPIDFPETNGVHAETQVDYLSLPTYTHRGIEGNVISCWQFTWKERLKVLFGKPMWFTVMTFGGPLQPQLPSLGKPWQLD